MPSLERYFDRQGRPLRLMEWARLLDDDDYRRVAVTDVGHWTVSTVWLGIDYNFGRGVPLMFETMTFDTSVKHEIDGQEYSESGDCWRWPTEEAALAGHDQAVAALKDEARR